MIEERKVRRRPSKDAELFCVTGCLVSAVDRPARPSQEERGGQLNRPVRVSLFPHVTHITREALDSICCGAWLAQISAASLGCILNANDGYLPHSMHLTACRDCVWLHSGLTSNRHIFLSWLETALGAR